MPDMQICTLPLEVQWIPKARQQLAIIRIYRGGGSR
jgi:hypothetical protein